MRKAPIFGNRKPKYRTMFDTEITPLKSLDTYLRKLVEGRLWLQVIISMVLGVLVGIVLSPELGWVSPRLSEILGNWLALPGQLFLKLVQMIMIPLIFASIIRGIASNDPEQLKKMGLGVVLYFVFTTIISVGIGTVLATVFEPGALMYTDATPPIADLAASQENGKTLPHWGICHRLFRNCYLTTHWHLWYRVKCSLL